MTYEELEKAYQQGKATMPVCHFNHCEFVMDGKRYFAGWSSEGTTKWANEYGRNIRQVKGWIVYKVEEERSEP